MTMIVLHGSSNFALFTFSAKILAENHKKWRQLVSSGNRFLNVCLLCVLKRRPFGEVGQSRFYNQFQNSFFLDGFPNEKTFREFSGGALHLGENN